MTPTLRYQRWLEFDPPYATPPQWSWPLPLSDGRVIVTLLYRPLGPGKNAPQTVILELSPKGDSSLWTPGQGYPAPVLFAVGQWGGDDELIGFDLVRRGKVYACLPDGTHRWTLSARPAMANLIAPRYFQRQGNTLTWEEERTGLHQATLNPDNTISNIQKLPPNTPVPFPPEVRFPHTHLTPDGSLFILDFDPMPRITRYQLTP